MVVILAVNYILWIFLFGIVFLILGSVTSHPALMETFEAQLKGFGVDLDAFLKVATSSFGSLMFTNLPLYVAIMSGTSVLHDRECGTMPFLMLAPLTRRKLLMGKLVGAMVIPLVLHIIFVGASSLLFGSIDALAPYAFKFGGTPAWWVAFLAGAPASAAFVGSLGTVISALSRDIRTSMQFTSFFIGLLSLGIGYVLVDGVAKGVFMQLAYAIACLAASGLTLLFGAWLISKDVTSA